MSAPVVWLMKLTGQANGGVPYTAPFTAFGIEVPQCRFRSLDDDEFSFEQRQNVFATPQFYFGDQVSIYQVANGTTTCWFIGTVTKRTIIGEVGKEVIKFVVSGPWYQLKRLMWQAPALCYSGACAQDQVNMTKIVLFQNPTTGASISTGQQIQNAINYAVANGVAMAAGSLPAFVTVPLEETRDLTIADVIRRCVQWTPDAVSWFSYASGVPIFNVAQRAFLSTTSFDLSQVNEVKGFELIPRDDLVPIGVVFNYIGFAFCNVPVPNGCADPTTGITNTSGGTVLSNGKVQVQTITQDIAGIPNLPSAIIASVDLTALTATSTEAAPIGLAGEYFLSLITTIWDGSITIQQQEVGGQMRPGLALNLLNGNSLWATMNAQIQEVVEDLGTGTTTATFGTPGHLSPQNFATLIQLTRRRPLVTSGLAAVTTPQVTVGGVTSSNCAPGIKPETKKTLDTLTNNPGAVGTATTNTPQFNTCSIAVCEGGSSKNISLYCPPQ